jgi:histidinol dehydrogenase
LTNSIDLAEAVEKETIRLFPQLGKLREEIEKRLMKNCFIGIANIDLCLDFVNAFGPEHLEIISKEADEIARRVINAGLILIGNYTPASLSDYCLGTNHVLPTGGYSRYQSRLSVLDFVKLIQITKSSKKTIENIGKFAATLAESEKFLAHTMSLLRRIT